MEGSNNLGILRFIGQIEGITVQILVDGGSSDNFLQPRLAHFLYLSIEPPPPFNVLVGNGQTMAIEGMIPNLTVTIQGHHLQVPVYLLSVLGADIVVGSKWLATLGPHVADYKSLSLKFYHQDQFITLVGDKSAKPLQTQFNHIRRMHHTNSIVAMLALQMLPPDPIPDHMLDFPQDMPPDLISLLQQYSEVFHTPSGLPPPRDQNHAITLIQGTDPIKVRPYRYPHSQKEQIEKMVQEMLEQGIIQPSTSPFSSPIILVKKKDGTWRFCTDYRALNALTVEDSFPMPTVDELLDELHGAKFFSKLDLRSGFHQILMQPEDRHKTAFRTHHGHYEWLVMPFGLTNAPATFQCFMNKVFQSVLRKFVLVFFDDILVYSSTWSAHLQHLARVLQTLRQHVLFVKLSKCFFGMTQVDYLGHTISRQGVAMEKNKIEAVLAWQHPTNVKQLRGFLGLNGYCRRFIKGYAALAAPLFNLLKKDDFLWSPATEAAFVQLKQAITSAPVLTLPDFSKLFVLETDASGIGIGAVLSQDNHPVAFFSKKLAPRYLRQ